MSMPAEKPRRYTIEEYFAMEVAMPDAKLEYRDGEIVNLRELQSLDPQGMAGGSRRQIRWGPSLRPFTILWDNLG